MKVQLEKQPFQNKGIELVSQNDTERLMLERFMLQGCGMAEFSRNQDGSVTLVIVPEQNKKME